MKHINLSVPGGQGLDGTGLVEMKRAELKEVDGGWFTVASAYVGVAIAVIKSAIEDFRDGFLESAHECKCY